MTITDIARALGGRGGRARARRLSRARKRAIAAMGAKARLRSLRAEQNIIAKFRYAEAVRQLRGEPVRVTRGHRSIGRLPGIYRNES